MAEDSESRTEAATPARLTRAQSEGHAPVSHELASLANLGAAILIIVCYAPQLSRSAMSRLAALLANAGSIDSPAAMHREKRYPLRAKVCETCKLVQLDYDVAPQELFGNYVYFSSYSDQWLAHAKAYCDMAQERFALGSSSLVVELASNDGYLLKNFLTMGIPVLGIDPSDTVAAAAIKIGVHFGEENA